MADTPELTGENRNPDGTFKDGVSGNPAGRPLGSISIIGIIKQKLAEVPIGQRRTLAETLAEQILDGAIVGKSENMQREIMHYIDGMPKQAMDLAVDKESMPALTEFFRALAKPHDGTGSTGV